MVVDADLGEERLRLAESFKMIDGIEAALEWQIEVANSIRSAERLEDRQEGKFHIDIVRRMVDALAVMVLQRHFVREFGRYRLRPPQLSGQGADFDFVISTARYLAGIGVVPLIADLTNMISVSDIVAATPDGILVVECKNRTPPAVRRVRGRLFRQMRRREAAAEYISNDEVVEDSGERRIALDSDIVVEFPMAAIKRCIVEAEQSSSGVCFGSLGENDYFAAAWRQEGIGFEAAKAAFAEEMPKMGGDRWLYPDFAGGSSFTRVGSLWYLNSFELDMPAGYQLALAEGDLTLWRFVDLAPLIGPIPGVAASIQMDGASKAWALVIKESDGREQNIYSRFLDSVVFGFLPVEAVANQLRSFCAQAMRDERGTPSQDAESPSAIPGSSDAPDNAAYGHPVLSAVAYINPLDESPPVVFEFDGDE